MKTSWSEKLNKTRTSKIKRLDFNFSDIPAGCTMLVATPQIINEYIRKIKKGNNISVRTLREDLAIENNAEYTCPVSTGIFLRIVAEAAYEQYVKSSSLKGITPFWRVIDPKSALAGKLSFGAEFIIEQRSKEK